MDSGAISTRGFDVRTMHKPRLVRFRPPHKGRFQWSAGFTLREVDTPRCDPFKIGPSRDAARPQNSPGREIQFCVYSDVFTKQYASARANPVGRCRCTAELIATSS